MPSKERVPPIGTFYATKISPPAKRPRTSSDNVPISHPKGLSSNTRDATQDLDVHRANSQASGEVVVPLTPSRSPNEVIDSDEEDTDAPSPSPTPKLRSLRQRKSSLLPLDGGEARLPDALSKCGESDDDEPIHYSSSSESSDDDDVVLTSHPRQILAVLAVEEGEKLNVACPGHETRSPSTAHRQFGEFLEKTLLEIKTKEATVESAGVETRKGGVDC